MHEIIVRGCRLTGRDDTCDVALAGGRVAAVAPRLDAPARRELAARGRLLLPGFVNARLPVAAAPPELEGWAAVALERAVRHGTTRLRLSVTMEADEPLGPLRLLARVRARHAERLAVELALALPAGRLVQPKRFRHLLDEARRAGADAIEAAPGRDDIAAPGFDELLAWLRDAALPLDLALDRELPPSRVGLDALALPRALEALARARLRDLVRVVDVSALAAVHRDDAAPLLAELAARQIALVICPHDALGRGGRADRAAARRGLPRLREIVAAGVEVRLGGAADPLAAAWIAGYASHMGVPRALEQLRTMLTGPTRVEPGAPADLVVLDAPTFAEAVVDHAEKLAVFKDGRLVSENHRTSERAAPVELRERAALTIRGAALARRPGRHDVVVVDGIIRNVAPTGVGRLGATGASIRPPTAQTGRADPVTIEADGRLLTPAFIDAHLHVDKTFVMDRAGLGVGNLAVAEAVSAMRAIKAGYTRDDLLARGRLTLERALRHGTTAIRAQCDVDPIIGLLALEALVTLKREWAPLVDVQIVAFPQEGLVSNPRAIELMREALRQGADLVGGGPLDADHRAHIAEGFRLAVEAGAGVDIHADLSIDDLRAPVEWEAPLIAQHARAVGLGGRVAIGHFASSSALTAEALAPIAEALAEAGVSVAALPASELYRQGMADAVNSRRGIPRVRDLLAAGVNVVFASNNIRDAFVTFGAADMLEQAWLGALTAHLDTLDDLATALDMVTARPAALMGLRDRGAVEVGKQADLVLLDAASPAEALADQVEKLYVIRRGRIVVRNTRTHHATDLAS
ncbi:MAG: amidohydrolase family protein [Candidatus Rokubacteria bacterium]|nr:amidohydrolase family protein [Candidatus Rokubacteria bacterium]